MTTLCVKLPIKTIAMSVYIYIYIIHIIYIYIYINYYIKVNPEDDLTVADAIEDFDSEAGVGGKQVWCCF